MWGESVMKRQWGGQRVEVTEGPQRGLVCRNLIRRWKVMTRKGKTKMNLCLLYSSEFSFVSHPPQQTHLPICLSVSISCRWKCVYTERLFRSFREQIWAELIRTFKRTSVTRGGKKHKHIISNLHYLTCTYTPCCTPGSLHIQRSHAYSG